MSADIENEAKAEAARLRMYAGAVERLSKAKTDTDTMNALCTLSVSSSQPREALEHIERLEAMARKANSDEYVKRALRFKAEALRDSAPHEVDWAAVRQAGESYQEHLLKIGADSDVLYDATLFHADVETRAGDFPRAEAYLGAAETLKEAMWLDSDRREIDRDSDAAMLLEAKIQLAKATNDGSRQAALEAELAVVGERMSVHYGEALTKIKASMVEEIEADKKARILVMAFGLVIAAIVLYFTHGN